MISFTALAWALSTGAKLQAPVNPVPFTSVQLHDGFWAPKLEVNRTITIPYAFRMDEETGRMKNFENAAATLRGEDPKGKPLPGFPFDDTDVYKVLEGAAYSLSVHPDPKLDQYLDSLIEKIAAAQEPDGYIYTARTINPAHPHDWSGPVRWVNEEEQSHELYDLGHLYEAAAAHYQATKKRSLLNIAMKSVALLDNTFGPGKKKIWPGHEIVEMGLVKLYRVTGDQKCLDLAKFFLDCRGGKRDGSYWQADKPVVDQDEAVGHAVRASYLYSGMADIAGLTGNAAYLSASDKLWQNVVDKKLYITGGIGATASGEAFGGNYELPNMSAYCETCAAVGNDYWNERLFLLHGDARYVDVLERTLYNGLISGVGLDGKSFFYPNPLESRGQLLRSAWFGCACCPGNITRFLPSLPGYFYATQGSTVFVNLFAASTAHIDIPAGGKVTIDQETQYPWDGKIRMTVKPSGVRRFTLNVRIPGWALDEPVPSDLYRFAGAKKAPISLSVNREPVAVSLVKGYAAIARDWKPGDVVELNLPMRVQRVMANAKVAEDRDRVALQRGPIVYCAEWKDNATSVRNMVLPDNASVTAAYQPKLLGGVVTLRADVKSLAYDATGKVVAKDAVLTAIPYYAWANRGKGEMAVWLPDSLASAKPAPLPTLAMVSEVKTSGGTSPESIHDLVEAKSSDDPSSFFHWWPKKGTTEWVECKFPHPTKVSESNLYWFDDTGRGECRLPKGWRLYYRDGETWKPVVTSDAFGTAKDRYNHVSFTPVTTSGLRIEVDLQAGWSAGIHQWKVK